MYSTCMFCNRSLGANEVLEHFPVGRRLAFDAAKGRLWVVCRGCERWNLSPLEERWEAVEMCERIFRETTLRVSTENVGLAKHAEGLELDSAVQFRAGQTAAGVGSDGLRIEIDRFSHVEIIERLRRAVRHCA